MTLAEIKAAINAGKKVHWASDFYVVEKHGKGDKEQWLVRCTYNDSCVGLTWADGTLNDSPFMYYIAGEGKPPTKDQIWGQERLRDYREKWGRQ